MSQSKNPQDQNQSLLLNIGFSLVSQVGFAVVGVVLIAVFLGIWLDKTLGTKPVFTILLLVGSGPASLYLVLRLATAAVAKISPLNIKSGGEKSNDSKEDNKE